MLNKFFQKPAAIFWTFVLAYSLSWAGHYSSGDGMQKVAWAKRILAGHLGGEQVSKYGIGHSLLALLPLGLARAIAKISHIKPEAALYTYLFIVNGAFFLYLVGVYLWDKYPIRRIWTVLCVLGFATIWWPYTKLDFSEPLVLTFVFAGFLLAHKGHPAIGFAIAGFAGTFRTDAFL